MQMVPDAAAWVIAPDFAKQKSGEQRGGEVVKLFKGHPLVRLGHEHRAKGLYKAAPIVREPHDRATRVHGQSVDHDVRA